MCGVYLPRSTASVAVPSSPTNSRPVIEAFRGQDNNGVTAAACVFLMRRPKRRASWNRSDSPGSDAETSLGLGRRTHALRSCHRCRRRCCQRDGSGRRTKISAGRAIGDSRAGEICTAVNLGRSEHRRLAVRRRHNPALALSFSSGDPGERTSPGRGSYEVLARAAGTTVQLDERTSVTRSPLQANPRAEIWSQRPPLAASAKSDPNSPPDEPKGT
jgi:hypothetical protein